MQFIEMTGKTLFRVIDGCGPTQAELAEVGVNEDSIVRVNRQGDIELRRSDRWDVIGGLLGDFEPRVKAATRLTWARPIVSNAEETDDA
jgi:hypothetical protein